MAGQGGPGAPASAAMHDASYTASFADRGNAKFAKVMGKPAACLTYDAAGNVIWMTNQNPSDGQVAYAYSDLTKYTAPSTVTPDATSALANGYSYDSLLGLTQATAPNGASTAFSYENLRRPASTTSVHGAVTTYAYNDSASAPSVTATTNGKFVKTSMDGLGRTVKVETGYGSTVVSIAETEYGPCACSPLGKVKRVSRPYAPGGAMSNPGAEGDEDVLPYLPVGGAQGTVRLKQGKIQFVRVPGR